MRKLKKRHIAAGAAAAVSAAATPLAAAAAIARRGQAAFGGEYLTVLFGLMAAILIIEAAGMWDEMKGGSNTLPPRRGKPPRAKIRAEAAAGTPGTEPGGAAAARGVEKHKHPAAEKGR